MTFLKRAKKALLMTIKATAETIPFSSVDRASSCIPSDKMDNATSSKQNAWKEHSKTGRSSQQKSFFAFSRYACPDTEPRFFSQERFI